MKKIKVLNICGGLSPEGISVFMLNTLNAIDRAKFDYDFALATKYPQYFEQYVLDKGASVYRTYELSDGLKGKILHLFNLYKILKNENVDVVHSQMDFFNGLNLFVAFLAGVKVRVAHAHFYNLNEIPLSLKIYRKTLSAMIKCFATHRIGCSLEATNYMNGGGTVLYNGIDLTKFNHQNSLQNNTLQIVSIGRIDHQKNPFFMLEIIEQLKKKNLQFHFHWIGNGALYHTVKNKINELDLQDCITLHGVKDNLHEFLPNMDVFLFPSLFEGLPISLLEAQFSGLQCYISENIPEVTNLGLCHQLKLSLGAEKWAEIIKSNIENKVVLSIDETKAKQFDLKHTTKLLENIYFNALKK